MQSRAIASIRSFNRTVADRIGALSDQFLGRDRPMACSRTLWEVGPDGIEVRTLRAKLGLDSGYASRILRALQREGLIRVRTSRRDRRVRSVHLTDAGRAERRELDRRSDALAWSFLEPLDDPKRERLISAVIEVDRLLRASMVTLAIEDPSTSDARWCIRQYFLELDVRFEQGFDPSQSIPADEGDLIMPTGALVIARLQGQPIGCGALKFHGSRPTELKRMWVTPEARGLGVGRRILMELERIARDAGSHVVRLETNQALTEAISLYRTSGYREVEAFNDEPYAHHWFQKQLRPRRAAMRGKR